MPDVKRISIQGGSFNADGIEDADTVNVVIVNAASIGRAYYEGAFDPSNPAAPTCWSTNTYVPAPDVTVRGKQATRCLDCSKNIRGSGSYGGRACRFSQRIAVALEEDLENVYQLQVPANSIFGAALETKTPLQAYVKFLHARGTKVAGVITSMYFDTSGDVPRVLFKALRPVGEQETEIVNRVAEHPDTVAAIKQQVFMPDVVRTSPFQVEDGFNSNSDGA